jgi:aquaporin Z
MYNYLVEFLGTSFLVYIFLATASPIAIGISLSLIILLGRNISGGYFNPAVTIVMASVGQLPTGDIIPYCASQILGGLVALELYKRYQI